MFLKKYILFCLLITLNTHADDIKNLLEDLNEYSDKNHLNMDYKPSDMTILYADDLEVLGINTLSKALDFVPGIQTFETTYFSSIVSVRGHTKPFSTFQNEIEFKIDGMSVASNYFENFPMSLIERIEISKGSDSIIYGKSGYVAVINIVTKNKNNVTLGTGSFDRRNGSFIINEKLDDSWDIKLDVYYLKHNKTVDAINGITTNSDYFGTTFNREKTSLEGKEDKAIGVLLKNGDFKISSRYIDAFKQNNYGFTGLLDFNDEGYTNYKTFVNEVSYDTFVSQNNSLETKLSFLQNNYQLNTFLYDIEPNTYGLYNPHYKVNYTEQESSLSFLMRNTTFDNHSIGYGLQASVFDITKNDYYTNADRLYEVGFLYEVVDPNGVKSKEYFPTQRELVKFSGNDGFVRDTSSKTNLSYFFNDKYDFNENLSFLFNLSLDDYESNEKQINYKIGTVYSDDNVNVYKLIFSQSNRNPSMVENYITGHSLILGNENLEAEEMQNAELMYIYQENSQKLKVNFFYSIYKNSIDLLKVNDNTMQYYNKEDDDIGYGAELEYRKNFENRSKLFFNGSYNIFKYKNNDLSINTPIVSKDTVKLGYIYPLNSKINVSILAKYYGVKEVLEDNDSIPSVILYDSGIQYNLSKNSRISLNVQNIFDKEYYYWGSSTTNEKMLREGRTFYTSFSYDF